MPPLQHISRQIDRANTINREVFDIAQTQCHIAHFLINKCVIFVASLGGNETY